MPLPDLGERRLLSRNVFVSRMSPFNAVRAVRRINMVSFTDLQNGFYNNMLAALALPAGYPLQLFQPSSPLPPGTGDQQLWNFFNNIPPATVTFSTLSGGAQFFSNYSGLISALVAPDNNFQEDIGPCYEPWIKYITNFNPWPAAN